MPIHILFFDKTKGMLFYVCGGHTGFLHNPNPMYIKHLQTNKINNKTPKTRFYGHSHPLLDNITLQ